MCKGDRMKYLSLKGIKRYWRYAKSGNFEVLSLYLTSKRCSIMLFGCVYALIGLEYDFTVFGAYFKITLFWQYFAIAVRRGEILLFFNGHTIWEKKQNLENNEESK